MRAFLLPAFAAALLLAPGLVLAASHGEAPPGDADWVNGAYVITLENYEDVQVDGDLDVHRIRLADGESYSADDLRNAYQGSGSRQWQAIGEAFIEQVESELAATLESALRAAFPQAPEISVDATVDRASLDQDIAGSAFDPPVRATVTAAASRPLAALGAGDLTEGGLDAVFLAGAHVTTQMRLSAPPGHVNTYTLTPPEDLAFTTPDADSGHVLAADGRSLVILVDNASGTREGVTVAATLHHPDVTLPDEEDAAVTVTVDLKDLDVTLAGAASGDFGALLVDVAVEGHLGVVALTGSFRDALPPSVDLEYVTADAIRLFREEGVLSEDALEALESGLVDAMQARLGSAFGGAAVTVEGGFDAASLEGTVDGPLTGDSPIVFAATTSLSIPLGGNGGDVQTQAAITLYEMSQTFPLHKVEGLETTYRVIFPKGIAVASADATGGTVTTGRTDDNRDYFEATPEDDRADVTVQMAVTPMFVIAKFWPVLLAAVALLALMVAAPVVALIRRRKNR